MHNNYTSIINMKRFLFILLLGFFALNLAFCQSKHKVKHKFPKPKGFVNDYENIFTKEQFDTLTIMIFNHEASTTNQVAIVTIDSFAPYPNLYDYTLDLFNTWGIGTKEKNNGIAIIFGKQIRQIRIMTGTGLETKLTDEEAKMIIDNVIIPEFKNENYYYGLKLGLMEIFKEIE